MGQLWGILEGPRGRHWPVLQALLYRRDSTPQTYPLSLNFSSSLAPAEMSECPHLSIIGADKISARRATPDELLGEEPAMG